ncbi:hypothetical protein ACQP2F_32835 [Actinoplanes sp. CA-030573]|uniref:hypothetical protein n=1 Tax=Actinoplanes sp. CA-030573 TaxID=3239898 RepID=UPI003D8F2374
MAQPAAPLPDRRLELTLPEARPRFTQLVRLATLNQQITTITDAGRPVAVIAPPDRVRGPGEPTADATPRPTPAEGWIRRIEQVRAEVRRQHQSRITELETALHEAWQALDALQPPGKDPRIDALRVLHGDIRRARPEQPPTPVPHAA